MNQDNSEIPQKNPFLASNLNLLKVKDPLLHEKIVNAEPISVIEKKIEGDSILSITVSGPGAKPLMFQSRKASQNVVPLMAYKDIGNYDVVVILGFGLGEHVREIIEASSEGTFILIIEQSLEFFKEIINYVDLGPFFKDRISLSVGEAPFQATRKRLEDYFGVYSIEDIKIFRSPASIELAQSQYAEIDKQLSELSEVARQNLATLKKFSGIWQRHILSNLKSVVLKPGINELFDKFQGVPAIIVSAGPSLDKNLHWLAGAKGKSLIIAVDTALKSLLKCGIKPDVVMSLDALEDNYKHLEGIKEEGICLIANPVAYPSIIKEFTGPVFIMNFGDPLMSWIEGRIGKKGETLSGGSIATSVFDLACKLGNSPIIFAGQDLSYPGGRAYTEWCQFDRNWLDGICQYNTISEFHKLNISGGGIIYKKGIFGGEIGTSLKMFNWKRWFETMIKHYKVSCVNATEDGLEIEGAKKMTLKEAVSKYCREKVNVSGIFGETQSKYRTTDVRAFIEQLEGLKNNIARVGYMGKEGKNVSSVVLNISESTPHEQLQLNSYIQKMNVFAGQILNENEFIEINKWCIETLLDKMKIEEPSQEKMKDANYALLQNVRSFHTLFEGIDDMCSHYDSKLDSAIGELNQLL